MQKNSKDLETELNWCETFKQQLWRHNSSLTTEHQRRIITVLTILKSLLLGLYRVEFSWFEMYFFYIFIFVVRSAQNKDVFFNFSLGDVLGDLALLPRWLLREYFDLVSHHRTVFLKTIGKIKAEKTLF